MEERDPLPQQDDRQLGRGEQGKDAAQKALTDNPALGRKIVDAILALPGGSRLLLLAPLARFERG